MNRMRSLAATLLLGTSVTLSGCFLAAAGAGAGGAIYVTERGVEAQVASPVSRTLEAARQAFQAYSVTETRVVNTQEGAVEKHSLEGKTADREVDVDLRTEGTGTHVEVVVKKTAVTWDKDLAKKILNKIVEEAK